MNVYECPVGQVHELRYTGCETKTYYQGFIEDEMFSISDLTII